MHLFGGMVIALIYAWLQKAYSKIPALSFKNILITGKKLISL
jgi:hypothetical protein